MASYLRALELVDKTDLTSSVEELIERSSLEEIDIRTLAEAAIELEKFDIFTALTPHLSVAENCVLEILDIRLGKSASDPMHIIEKGLKFARDPATRDSLVEARLRIERGLCLYEKGNVSAARAEFEWAQHRFATIAEGSRGHGLATLNRIAFHLSIGEDLLALHLCSEVTRDGPHLTLTKGLVRLEAGRILSAYGRNDEALRVLWISAHLLIESAAFDAAETASHLWLKIARSYQGQAMGQLGLLTGIGPCCDEEGVVSSPISDFDLEIITKISSISNSL